MNDENFFEAPNSKLLPTPNLAKTVLIIASAKQMLAYHQHGSLSYASLNTRNWRRLLISLIFLAVIGFTAFGDSRRFPPFSEFVFAFLLGTMIRDQAWYAKIAKSWWMTERFTNWSRVQEIADMDPADPI